MIEILKTSTYFLNLLGDQQVKANISYRLLNYVIILEYDQSYLLYNNLTKCFIALNYDEFKDIQSHNFKITSTIKYLIEKWFLVPKTNDDSIIRNQVYTIAKMLDKPRGFNHYNIFTTTDCNARCFYCFEAGVPKETMSLDVAKKVVEYILDKSSDDKITINWFGGEPLLNIAAIDQIIYSLKAAHKTFSTTITTNGFLFDKMTISKAKNDWNLKSALITLDGTEQIYNKCKNYIYKDVDNPYAIVLDNIKNLIEKEIYVKIRVNLDMHNEAIVYDLIDELYKKYGNNHNYSIAVKLLYGNKKDDNKYIQLMDKLNKIEEYLFERNILYVSNLSSKIAIGNCKADSNSAIVILPNGNLTRCEHFINDNFVGTIYDNKIDEDVWNSFSKKIKYHYQCNVCALYPTCNKIEKCPITRENICDKYSVDDKLRKIKRSMIKEYNLFKSRIDNS